MKFNLSRRPREKRVLFLSAYVGTGHMSAAEAVRKAVLEIEPRAETLVLDAYTYAGPVLAKIASQGYLQLVKFLPRVYSFLYSLPRRHPDLSAWKTRLTRKVAKKFRALVEEYEPDVLVSTHAFASGIASLLKEQYGFPTVSIVTDFTVHPFWLHANTDLYLVGNPELRDHLIGQGIESDRVRVTGIPVDSRFGVREDKQKIRKKLGLDPGMRTILIMGGGAGLGPIGAIFRHLEKISHPVCVLVVAGNNRRLKRKMENLARRFHKRGRKSGGAVREVRVYGYAQNVYDLMNAADLLISKPGGLTSSEALAAELPIAIVRPLPGQEVHNARYLAREHAALTVRRPRDITGVVENLLSHPEELSAFAGKARALKKPKAAKAAARAVLELIKVHSPIQ